LPIASNRYRPEPAAKSHAHRDLQAGLLEAGLQCRELAGELAEFAVAEFGKDEIVELLLLEARPAMCL
jgi:hypothetical protein